MNTMERIYTQADDYGFRVPYDGSKKFYDDSAVKGYIAGATLERNITIDEVMKFMDNTENFAHWWDDEPELQGHIEGATSAFNLLRKHLNSLKV